MKEIEDMSIAELGAALKSKKDELNALKEATAEIQKEFDQLRRVIVPEQMNKIGIDSVKITGVGRLSLRSELYASIDPEHKEDAFNWLRANGYEDTIKPGVNSSTLKASVKECIINGIELPDEIFNVSPYDMAVITKT